MEEFSSIRAARALSRGITEGCEMVRSLVFELRLCKVFLDLVLDALSSLKGDKLGVEA